MIKVYGMASCPDCIAIEPIVKNNPNYEYMDIGSHVRLLKEFLRLRDQSNAFDEARKNGSVGIPCFVLEDGSVTLAPEKAGLALSDPPQGSSCSIDGSGC